MVMTLQEAKELETLKHNQKLELLKAQAEKEEEEHNRKMERLEKILKIMEISGGRDFPQI